MFACCGSMMFDCFGWWFGFDCLLHDALFGVCWTCYAFVVGCFMLCCWVGFGRLVGLISVNCLIFYLSLYVLLL